ncbi:hypothetical protein ABZ671_19895 [Micromonospora sp. NPDC006766]|uniref:hypothetical protein n=1 Tax=Micromonospora sp. NPDC006766 TaxID=3154778 RepID=UPI0033EE2092
MIAEEAELDPLPPRHLIACALLRALHPHFALHLTDDRVDLRKQDTELRELRTQPTEPHGQGLQKLFIA